MLDTAQPNPDREPVLELLVRLGVIAPDETDRLTHLTYDELVDLAGIFHEAIGEMRVSIGRSVRSCAGYSFCHPSPGRRRSRHCRHGAANRYQHRG